jgi:cell division protein FtsN
MSYFFRSKFSVYCCCILLTWNACGSDQAQNEADSLAQKAKSEPTLLLEPERELTTRTSEDIPVEDRKYLMDSSVVAAQAHRGRSESNSDAIQRHIPVPPDPEKQKFYLVAGSFTEDKEAQLMINYLETEGLSAVIVPRKKIRRVAIEVLATEDNARSLLDSLNNKYQGVIEFWLLHGM